MIPCLYVSISVYNGMFKYIIHILMYKVHLYNISWSYMGVSKNKGYPMVYNGKPYEQMDDLGSKTPPLFLVQHPYIPLDRFFAHPSPPVDHGKPRETQPIPASQFNDLRFIGPWSKHSVGHMFFRRCFLSVNNPWTPKPWKMKVLNPPIYGWNHP